jgi:hypothetical protein
MEVLIAIIAIWVQAPALNEAWQDLPARYEIANDVRTVAVFDAEGNELPCKVQQQREKRFVYWSRTDDGTTSARYRIDLHAKSSLPPAVFVGAGDMLEYGRKDVVADLGAGMWSTPLPIDWDGDGQMDLLYSCTDRPQNGLYLYKQISDGVFERMERIGDGYDFPQLCDMNGDGKVDMITWNVWFDDIRANGTTKPQVVPINLPMEGVKGLMMRQVDWDGDGLLDVIAGGVYYGVQPQRDQVGYDATGKWQLERGNGYVWFYRNTASNEAPAFADPVQLEAEDKPIDRTNRPCPTPGDWNGDGRMDLLCGDFLDTFTFFENTGAGTEPILARGMPVMTKKEPLRLDLCMMSPTAYDWDGDGLLDLVVGEEDGRVAVALNQGMIDGLLHFSEPVYLKETNQPIKSGGLSRPWLDEATGDLFTGNTAGYIERFAWHDGAFANGVSLRTSEGVFRVQAGYNGSPQGPSEAKWGYTEPTVGDLDNDGQPEIIYNSCWGRIERLVFENGNTVSAPTPVQVAWEGEPLYPEWNWWKPAANELVVQWRSRPIVLDWDGDGINDLIAQDHEGYMAFYRNNGEMLEPGQRVFLDAQGAPLRLNDQVVGKSGRAVLSLVDWTGDGLVDILRDSSEGLCVGWFENTGTAFVWRGDFPGRPLAGHSNAPQAVDWNKDGKHDLIVGAEDGRIYCYHRAAIEAPDKLDATLVEPPA